MIKVYDTVWVMRSNNLTELRVFAITECANLCDRKNNDIRYHLVHELCGSGWGNNEGEIYYPRSVFKTKEDLMKDLFKG